MRMDFSFYDLGSMEEEMALTLGPEQVESKPSLLLLSMKVQGSP